jgi:NADH:ubiquinone oxidoreductase subunit
MAAAAAIPPAGRGIINQQVAAAAAIPPAGRGIINQKVAAAAAIPPAGRGIINHKIAVAAVIRPAGRGIINQQVAAAAAIPPAGRGIINHQMAAAGAIPRVRQDQHVQPHMLVLQNLFDFVTGVLRSGATIKTYRTLSGYETTYAVQGNSFFNSCLYYYLLIISFFLQEMYLWLATTPVPTTWPTTSARPVPYS